MTRQSENYYRTEDVLGLLNAKNVVFFSKMRDGTFLVGECCDGYYEVELTHKQMESLIVELMELLHGPATEDDDDW